ncbi:MULTISPECIES: AraC family transcriptional regulator [unclassified Oleiphilus]|nr:MULTISPECIES: helix-turn-helix domain-containing protein [unclassified Oleiphilus]
MEHTKLTIESLSTTEMISLSDAIQIVHNVNKYSYTPIWPAIYGKHLGVATHGPIGYAAVSAPTVGRALSTFIEWFQIRSASYVSKIIESEENFEIVVFDTSGDDAYKQFFFESLMRAFEVLISLLAVESKCQTTLHFETNAEHRRELMKNEYASKLVFASDTNKLVVPKAMWFQASPLSDHDSHELNLRKCQQLMEQMEYKNRCDIAVRHLLRRHIEERILRQGDSELLPSLKQTSEALHYSERTLIRKLQQLETSYKEILEAERRSFADKLLRDARYTIFEIADILGYKESASFCRAFKNWFGQSPSAYRRSPRA